MKPEDSLAYSQEHQFSLTWEDKSNIHTWRQFNFDLEFSLFLDVTIGCEPVLKILSCMDGTSMYM
jgi:hypothetical protein